MDVLGGGGGSLMPIFYSANLFYFVTAEYSIYAVARLLGTTLVSCFRLLINEHLALLIAAAAGSVKMTSWSCESNIPSHAAQFTKVCQFLACKSHHSHMRLSAHPSVSRLVVSKGVQLWCNSRKRPRGESVGPVSAGLSRMALPNSESYDWRRALCYSRQAKPLSENHPAAG